MHQPDYKILSSRARGELAREFIKSFHEQFAINQNHHRSVFIQVIVVLVPLLTGYGYLFLRALDANDDGGATIGDHAIALYSYLLITAVILSLEIAVLLIMSLSYRRDQYVSASMRQKVGVLTPGSNENFFPGGYLPNKKDGLWNWIPDFNFIFICALVALKLALLLVTILHPNLSSPVPPCDAPASVITLLSCYVVLLGVDAALYVFYRWKWRRYLAGYEK